MARPKATEQRKRYTVRFLAVEMEHIQENADNALLTVSEYIRRCALGRRVKARTDIKAIGELSRLGGLQKHLVMNDPGNRAEYNKVIAAILSTIKSLNSRDT